MNDLVDWRDIDAAAVEPLYEREASRWQHALGWDTTAAWIAVESARRAGRVPGWVAFTGREPCGWAFGHLEGRTLQIGGLIADDAATTRRLLDAALTSPEATLATDVRCFFWPVTGAAPAALSRQRFTVSRSLYMVASCEGWADRGVLADAREWCHDDFVPAARLLACAYDGTAASALLAPGGTSAAWAQYLRRLIQTTGCGLFMPALSRVIAAREHLAGLALVTRLSGSTAHLAQLAIDPAARGRGHGAALTDQARAGAARAGFRTLSLLVEEENVAARALYARAGFTTQAVFIAAAKRIRRRARPERLSPGGPAATASATV